MKSDFAEFDFKSQNRLEVNITPPGDWMLANLGIDLAAPEFRELPPCKRAQYKAVKNWLTMYKPKRDASNIEKVRGYLEAFHHLCEVEDWERANQILFTSLDTPTNQSLHNQLGNWGYYLQQIEVYSPILHKLTSPIVNWGFLNGLGNAYQALGSYIVISNKYETLHCTISTNNFIKRCTRRCIHFSSL